MRYILLIATFLLLAFSQVAQISAQNKNCTPNLTSATTSLNEAQAALDENKIDSALTSIRDARNALQLIEANCSDFAPTTAGSSRTNPVSFGERHSVQTLDYFKGSIEITSYIDNADELVHQVDSNNPDPSQGMRYIVVNFNVYCEVDVSDTCEFRQRSWHIVGSKGLTYERVLGVHGFSDEQEMFGGSQISASLAFMVDAGETDFVLFNDDKKHRIYFALS